MVRWRRWGLIGIYLIIVVFSLPLVESRRDFRLRRFFSLPALFGKFDSSISKPRSADSEKGVNNKLTQVYGNESCNTEGCVRASFTLGMNMDRGIDPCEDFYQYACGGFLDRITIPEDKIIVDTIDSVQSELTENLKTIIEEPKSLKDGDAIKKLKELYTGCMDTATIKKLGLRPLEDLIKSFGGWPVVEGDNWNSQGFDWQKLIYKFKDKGVFYDFLLAVGVAPDPKDTTRNVIHLDRPQFIVGSHVSKREWDHSRMTIWSRPVTRKKTEDPSSSLRIYFDVLVGMATSLGAEENRARRELMHVVQFERELAEIARPKLYSSQPLNKGGYLLMDILGLIRIAPYIDWLDYFNEIISHRIRRDEKIIVMSPDYIQGLSTLLSKTESRTLANYLIWQAVQSVAPYLSPEFQDLIFSLHSYSTGQEKRQPRWLECLAFANRNMGLAMGALYVRKYFNTEAKRQVEEMVTYIRSEFETVLNENTWMDKNTLARAKAKNANMVYHIAYPDELLDNVVLDRFYRRLRINRRHHFTNSLRASKFRRQFNLGRLRKSAMKDSWVYHGEVANVNALYGVLENSIQIHAGMLHGWFFQPDRPQYLNFGSIGAVIGHEITHAFDNQGKNFDENGNLNSWWDPVTDLKFAQKASCFVKQYQNYTVKEINVKLNGLNTLGENIADNGGVKIAYKAYLRWAGRHKAELKLPGIDFTPKQLFWLSYANNWCGKMRPEVLHVYATRGRHSPNENRVNGPLSNLHEFNNDFNCRESSAMNSRIKCELW